MKHLFIVNPAAGKGKALKRISEIKEVFNSSKEEYVIEVTQKPGHATEIAMGYSNSEELRIYSIGGDGTLNEVLNGMAGSRCSLGVIPSGSGNDFIRSIYKSSVPADIVKRVIHGKEKYIDLGQVNGKYFLNISSAGIDAEVTYNAKELKKLPLISGSLAYILGIFITVFRHKSNHMMIKIDDLDISEKTLLIAVANGMYYGGGMKIAPSAILDDGTFEICHISDVRRLKILRLFPKLIKGEHESIEEVTFYKGKSVVLNCENEFTLNIDGELVRTKEAKFDILNKGIKIIVPE